LIDLLIEHKAHGFRNVLQIEPIALAKAAIMFKYSRNKTTRSSILGKSTQAERQSQAVFIFDSG